MPDPARAKAARERERWRAVAISATAPAGALVPGWPPLAAFVAALLAAVAGAALPVAHLSNSAPSGPASRCAGETAAALHCIDSDASMMLA